MGKTDEEICVGYLHDTIEDTDMACEKLLSLGVSKDIVDSVHILTHEFSVPPPFDYIQSIIDSQGKTAIHSKSTIKGTIYVVLGNMVSISKWRNARLL